MIIAGFLLRRQNASGPAAPVPAAEEPLEDARLLVGRDARTVVGHPQPHLVAIDDRAQRDAATVAGVADRVLG